MLWIDKYRPRGLSGLSYHDEITKRLQFFADQPSTLPHLLFYGPPGAGKKTRVMALLRSIYGPGAERLRLDKRTFTTPTNKSVDINMITSNYHIELCPGDAGLNDRYVVQDVIKEMAQSKSIATAGTTTEVGPGKKASIEYKVVILVEVDRLSRQAQAALRRTMEKYTTSCRLILICNNPSKVIDPVRSRCLGIRVPSPSHDQVSAISSRIQLHLYGVMV
jgi:replication factor C subunit 3/5